MEAAKVILLCSSRLALPALQQLAFFNQLGAVIVPAHCEEMSENSKFILTKSGIPVFLVDRDSFASKIKDCVEEQLGSMGLVITFSYKIPSMVYLLPRYGFYNIHPGPLPEYRGADPVFQQIKNREKQAGVTLHKLGDGFDSGPVVMKEMIRLEPTDTYGLLTSKLADVAARLTMTLLKLQSFDVDIPSRLQDESKAVYYKRQTATDVTINWQQMDGNHIIALINACNPWNKGASTMINNKVIRFLDAENYSEHSIQSESAAGTVLRLDKTGMIVSTINNEVICVRIVHTDEGFLMAGRLQELGVQTGQHFEMLHQ